MDKVEMNAHERGLKAAIMSHYRVPLHQSERGMHEAIAAYLEASGMVIVPKAPTNAMIDAWNAGYFEGFDKADVAGTTAENARMCFCYAHRAMISASPSPFKKQGENG